VIKKNIKMKIKNINNKVNKKWRSMELLANDMVIHREHTLLLNRKRVNKGMKRTNSLPCPLLF